jgi:hypothetical protein
MFLATDAATLVAGMWFGGPFELVYAYMTEHYDEVRAARKKLFGRGA